MIDRSEQERLQQRFISRTRALSFLRVGLLVMTQVFHLEPLWILWVLLAITFSHVFASEARWGRVCVFLSLNVDLVCQAYAMSQTGFFKSPLLACLPALTLIFSILFHRPFAVLPPLLLLPVLTALDPEVSLEILALYSVLNACIIYLTNRILGEEEATSYHIVKLEKALQKQAVTEERQRLSREIHDGVGSVLSALVIEAEQSQNLEIRDLAREALQETRYAISIMYDDLDLNWQIQHCVDLFSKRYHVQTRLSISEKLDIVPSGKSLSLLRILQESLSNIGKHAKASWVEIDATLEQNWLLLHIKDNGIGFDPQKIPKNHYGIRNIEERVRQMGGTVQIHSQPNLGTHIEIGALL